MATKKILNSVLAVSIFIFVFSCGKKTGKQEYTAEEDQIAVEEGYLPKADGFYEETESEEVRRFGLTVGTWYNEIYPLLNLSPQQSMFKHTGVYNSYYNLNYLIQMNVGNLEESGINLLYGCGFNGNISELYVLELIQKSNTNWNFKATKEIKVDNSKRSTITAIGYENVPKISISLSENDIDFKILNWCKDKKGEELSFSIRNNTKTNNESSNNSEQKKNFNGIDIKSYLNGKTFVSSDGEKFEYKESQDAIYINGNILGKILDRFVPFGNKYGDITYYAWKVVTQDKQEFMYNLSPDNQICDMSSPNGKIYYLKVSLNDNQYTWITGKWAPSEEYYAEGEIIIFNENGTFSLGDDCTTKGTYSIKENAVLLKGKTVCYGDEYNYSETIRIQGNRLEGYKKL